VAVIDKEAARPGGAGQAVPVAEFFFGWDSVATPLLGDGWSSPEAGYTWTVGSQSRLRLPATFGGNAPLVLELSLHGFCAPPACESQRLTVMLNGAVLGSATIAQPVTLAFMVPERAAASGVLDITLLHPDAVSPAACDVSGDTRPLALAVSAVRLWRLPPGGRDECAVFPPLPPEVFAKPGAPFSATGGLAPAPLAEPFVSLGQNCEFGLMQRMVGAEPLGLLRFAGIDLPDLLRGLDTGFADVENPEHFDFKSGMFLERMEYLVLAKRHGIRLHTHIYVDDTADINAVALRVVGYLRFLRRHFVHTLQEGGRIFVLQHPGVTSAAQALPVLARLCAYGRNRLLYVTEESDVPAGTVRREAEGLYHGAIDEFVPPDEGWRINVPAWLSLCANVWRAEYGGARDLPHISASRGAAWPGESLPGAAWLHTAVQGPEKGAGQDRQ
jgi:hypothetical protein